MWKTLPSRHTTLSAFDPAVQDAIPPALLPTGDAREAGVNPVVVDIMSCRWLLVPRTTREMGLVINSFGCFFFFFLFLLARTGKRLVMRRHL